MPFCSNCGAALPDAETRYCPRCGAPVLTAAIKSEADQQIFTVSQRPKIHARIHTPGSISVISGIEGQVSVSANITERGNIDYRAIQEGNLVSISSRTKTWDPLIWGSYVFSGGPRANIKIVVPRDADL